MRHVFPDFAYGSGPRSGCWWDETIAAPDWPQLRGDQKADVAIVGGGFTGMSAALHLAEAGVSVALLEARTPAWGASGRNGGFCCLGGARTDGATLTGRFGADGAADYWQAERDAVTLVAGLIDRLGMDVDRHSHGESQMAHNARAMDRLRRAAGQSDDIVLTERADLAGKGMNGPFHGAMTTRIGFGLNPRKYLFALSGAAVGAGARVFQNSPVQSLGRMKNGYIVQVPDGRVFCDKVVIATNGYSSEDLPDWLAARYLPTQSAVLVTRPLSDRELEAQGWTSDQMAYDSRNLLHYFRLMPDRRFLFGMRGGLLSSARSEARVQARVRSDFETMFAAWKDVPSPNRWSGMVCLARNLVPFVGPVPGNPGMFAGLAYHGNGIAMGSYAGRLLADLAQGHVPGVPYPAPMRQPMARFPLGRARRVILPPLYAWMRLLDI